MKLSAKEVKDMVMEGIKLPDNLTVNGDLDLSHTPIKSLPNNLVVIGNLFLKDTQIEMIQAGLTVTGCIDMHKTNI